jgi:hypothetical protein
MIGFGRSPAVFRSILFLLSAAALAASALTASALALPPVQYPYPTASTGSADARDGFDDRAFAVIAFNACGREADYAQFLGELKAGNFDNQGEPLTEILIAKAVYPIDPAKQCFGFVAQDQLPSIADCDEVIKDQAGRPKIVNDEAGQSFVQILVPRACRARQINEAVLAMRKNGALGSSGLRCVTSLRFGKGHGEFDVVVRGLVRLLYLAGADLLSGDTIDHMYKELLATSGPPSDGSYSQIADCTEPAGDELGSPEDRTDRYTWYNELGQDISDFFSWLIKFAVIAAAVPPALIASPFLLAAGVDPTDLNVPVPFADVRVSETENHRLQIESSKYLVNADIIARLEAENYGGLDGWKSDQAKVREWLLRRLQDITIHDFREYNSRPYTRYSLNAVLNLYDFASVHGDTALMTAAWIVLDLSEAKFAATSNRGRRTSPFRRHSSSDGYRADGSASTDQANLYNIITEGDHEVLRAMLLSNQTQLLPASRAPPNDAVHDAVINLVNPSVSAYRLPEPVLSTAVDRRTFAQTFVPAGLERAFQAPAFTVTAGGVPTEATASLFGKSDDDDFGVAMPTTIVPTIAGTSLNEIFRFDGVGIDSHKPGIGRNRTGNTCVAPGFACGLQPRLSDAFSKCTKGAVGVTDRVAFVNSQDCRPDQPAFYLASLTVDCSGTFCLQGHRWGIMDIIEAPSAAPADFLRFRNERGAAFNSVTPDDGGRASYTTATGLKIDFTVAASQPTVLSVNDAEPPPWSVNGDVVDADGQGHATIKGPGGPIAIDFTDWAKPTRTAPAPAAPPPVTGPPGGNCCR